LENDILQTEDKILEFSQSHQNEQLNYTIKKLRSDLKYLTALTNNAEIDNNEHKEVIQFLTKHYNYLQEQLANT
jgi:hypothetical protein